MATTKKPKPRRLKATFWTGTTRHSLDASGYSPDHLLAIYRLAVGEFSAEQMRRVIAAIENVPDESVVRRDDVEAAACGMEPNE